MQDPKHDHKVQILELVQKWMYQMITREEMAILDSWYFSLEEKHLELPDFVTMEIVEKRIYEQFFKPALFEVDESLPNPLHNPDWNK